MESVKLPPGLIRHDSEKGIAENKKLHFTNRMKAYSAVLIVLIGVETFLLLSRSDYDATILRAKGMLYQEQPNEQVSNLYTIKLINKTRDSMPVDVRLENMKGKVEIVGKALGVKKEGMNQGEFFVYLDKNLIKERKTKLVLGIYTHNKRVKIIKTNFLGPVDK